MRVTGLLLSAIGCLFLPLIRIIPEVGQPNTVTGPQLLLGHRLFLPFNKVIFEPDAFAIVAIAALIAAFVTSFFQGVSNRIVTAILAAIAFGSLFQWVPDLAFVFDDYKIANMTYQYLPAFYVALGLLAPAVLLTLGSLCTSWVHGRMQAPSMKASSL